MTLQLQAFIDRYPPGDATDKPDAAKLARYAGHLPASLLALWSAHGFGWYGDGLIQIIDPDKYRSQLWAWLLRGEEDLTRLPIAMNAFGVLFYYRKLSDEGDEDVSFLDPQTSETGVIDWSLDDFFNGACCDEEAPDAFLDAPLLAEAIALKGRLANDEIYSFQPALRLGGSRTAGHVDRGDATAQLALLLQLALGR